MVTITAYDHGGRLAVTVTDRHGERMTLSTPTGRQAGYPEARARNMDRAIAHVREEVADLARVYPGATIVGLDVVEAADPEAPVAPWSA